MAEWFKAADLRPAINDAWVRTPLAAFSKDLILHESGILQNLIPKVKN